MPRDPLSDVLIKSRREGEERDAQRRAEQLKIPYLNLATLPVETDAVGLIDEAEAKRAQAAAFEFKNNRVAIGAYDPTTPTMAAIVKELAGRKITATLFTVSLSSLNRVWDFYKFVTPKSAPISGRIDIDVKRLADLKSRLTDLKSVDKEITHFDFRTLPTSHVLEVVLAGAFANRASDIHFEPADKAVKLRYRIDGDLHDVTNALSLSVYGHLASRIKLLANMKLNVRDAAQDGRITIGLGNKEIEIRAAVAPSEFGEVIVLRVLDPDAISLTLEELGLRGDDLEIITTELDRPNGMILNTGPTGSGKTTTLYAFLKAKYASEIKIITIEDPIEYHLPGIEQTQVDPEADYTFANGLRSLMRQDPDVILIGEIRDGETATISIQAALTGHLVFSTVHANQASGAIPRLVDLGVKSTSIGPALNLIIAQRLVKRLCKECRVKSKPKSDQESAIKKFLAALPDRAKKEKEAPIEMFAPKGCSRCGNTGYYGRIAIYELLQISKEIESLMVKGGGEIEIQEFALKQGMVTMQQDGILKVLRGITTFDEVQKVTGPIEW